MLTIVDTVVFLVTIYVVVTYLLPIQNVPPVNINLRHIHVPPPGAAQYQRVRVDHQIKICQALCEISVLRYNISFLEDLLAHVNIHPETQAQYLLVRDILIIRSRGTERYLEGLVQASPFLDPSFF